MKMNVGEWLNHRAFMVGEKTGFVGKYSDYTFSEMNQRANRFADYLLKKGVQKGDRIALICKNHEDFVTAFFGSAKIGVITVPINWRLSTHETIYILSHSEAKAVVYDEAFNQDINELKPKTSVEIFICSGDSSTDETFENILNTYSKTEPEIISFDEDTILFMYTSGTTGKPKGAMITHNNLFAASIGLTHTIDWWAEDRFLLVAPFFHIGGFAPLIANVHVGCTTVLLEDFHPIKVWEIIEREKITSMMTVPAMLTVMADTVEKIKPDLSTLRYISCGASPVPPKLIETFRNLEISIKQVYGITEYTGAVSFWKESFDPDKYDSMGKPVMPGSLKSVDVDSQLELPSGEIGEILCKGPQVFKGYWKNEAATTQAFMGDWYKSGDMGKFDEGGFLYVVDRLKDMIISGGENIYSAEVEEILTDNHEVIEAAVVGIPNENWGEIPRAYIVKSENSSLTKEEIMEYCRTHLASFKVPKEVAFVEQLPRNAVGKILKNVLKDEAQKIS